MLIDPPCVQADGGLAEHFLHGVNLNDWIVVNNLRVSDGRLVSTEVLGLSDPGLAETYRPIGTVPISELASGWVEGNVASPRLGRFLFPAGIMNLGGEMVDAHGAPWPSSPGGKRRVIETAEAEIAFEVGRRRLSPAAPSRLTCIWLAEGSDAGRAVIQSMLRDTLICKVRVVSCHQFKVADAGWFDDYLNFPDLKYVDNYWLGVIHPRHSLPELLVEGVVQLTEQSAIDQIKQKRFARGMFN